MLAHASCAVAAFVVAATTIGCSHPATPDFSAYIGADVVTLHVDDDPSAYHANTEVARVVDSERRQRIVNLFAKYDGRWKRVMYTPPWPPGTLIAARGGETLDIMYFGLPNQGSSTVYVQKRIDGVDHFANISIRDYRELSRLMNAPDLTEIIDGQQ